MLDAENVIEVNTDLGPLLVEKDAELLTPTLLFTRIWEPELNHLMRRYLQEGMTVIDAGANIGYMSVLASQLVGESGRVFSVEADPSNIPILHANLDRLGKGNATVLPIAAWHEEAGLDLFSGDQGGAGSFVAAADSDEGLIRAAPLGDVVEGRVDFMKVDCEATDHLVVKGAAKLIDTNPDMLITVEFNPDFTGHTGFSPEGVLDVYRELGLSPFLISAEGVLEATTFEELATSGGSADESILYNFALCRGTPGPMRRKPKRKPLRWEVGRKFDSVLRLGGRMLDFVPEPIRPKIRRRDRLSR
jgi:FkbM family methyltransferase